MQVAVAAADETPAGALLQQRTKALEGRVRGFCKLLDLRGRNRIAAAQAIAVAIDQVWDRGNPCLTVGRSRCRMRGRDRVGDRRRKVRIEPSGLRQMIQRLILVE